MKWILPYRGSGLRGNGLGRIARRLAILAIPAVLAVGCGDSDDGPAPAATATATLPASTATATRPASTQTPLPTTTPTATPVDGNALTACAKLTGCDQCFINQTGQCIPNEACAERLSTDVAVCINGVSGCNQNTLGDCLFFGCDGNDATGECG